MTDKGHCMMPLDADEEFEIFYDFRRAYANLNVKRREKLNTITMEDTLQSAEKGFDMEQERQIKNGQKIASKE